MQIRITEAVLRREVINTSTVTIRVEYLGLGVAEAAVELEDARSVARQHEARVEHAAERAPLSAQAVHRALQHLLAHPLHLLVAHLQVEWTLL